MINQYHWFWYLFGLAFAPRLTFMILISIYFSNIVPLPLMIIGWIFALGDLGGRK